MKYLSSLVKYISVSQKQKKIVVLGGGTGSSVLLTGLKEYPVYLTAITPVTDDGGSTGRLRDEFGFLPVGDMRQCLAALAPENGLLRKLLLYRFEKGKGLSGHNLGNLILTALEDLVGSEPEVMIHAAKIFRLKGQILPISRKLLTLAARYSSGKTIVSEHKIENYQLKPNEKITKLYTKPQASIYAEAQKAIKEADLIVFPPGDLYNSIIANLIIKGTKKAIQNSKARLVQIINLMTLNSQTHNFSAKDHVLELEKYLNQEIDYIIINNQPIPDNILKAYQKLKEFPVKDDLQKDPRVIRQALLNQKTFQKPKTDRLKRSLLRHGPHKLSQVIISLINS